MRRSQNASPFFGSVLRCLPVLAVFLVVFNIVQASAVPSRRLPSGGFDVTRVALHARMSEPLPIRNPRKAIPDKLTRNPLRKAAILSQDDIIQKFTEVPGFAPENLVFYTGGIAYHSIEKWLGKHPKKRILEDVISASGVEFDSNKRGTIKLHGIQETRRQRTIRAYASAAEGSTEILLLVKPDYREELGRDSEWTKLEFPIIKALNSRPRVVTVVLDKEGNEIEIASRQLWPKH